MLSVEEAFEGLTPLAREVAARGPYPSVAELIARARAVIPTLTEEEKVQTLNGHPRIGEDPRRLSARALAEQGGDILAELRALNQAYERRFGFRFVVFVNRRPKSEIVDVLKERLAGSREQEMAAGLQAIVDIAEDRLRRPSTMDAGGTDRTKEVQRMSVERRTRTATLPEPATWSQAKSVAWLREAEAVAPGGVHTSIRRLNPTLGFIRAEGARLFDADGNTYIDYHNAFGPVILGHAHPAVVERASAAMRTLDLVGSGFTGGEVALCKKIVEHVPSAEKVLLANSGSEATYHAIRVARAFTGRKKIIKFQGCYHGWHDYVAMNVASPASRMGTRDLLSAGMLEEATQHTLIASFNDLDGVQRLMQEHRGQVAAIILEPIPHNVGCILPAPGFLTGLRTLTTQEGALLIFDEVISGFRHSLGGYQALARVTPDLTAMGKSLANGFPIAALAGRAAVMDRFNTRPGGDVYFAGTFNGHPVSTAAAVATIEQLEKPGTYEHLFELGERMRAGLKRITANLPIPTVVAGFGSIFVLYFTDRLPESYMDLLGNDAELFEGYRQGMIRRGVFEVPLNLKRSHIGVAHTQEDIDVTLNAAEDALRELVHG